MFDSINMAPAIHTDPASRNQALGVVRVSARLHIRSYQVFWSTFQMWVCRKFVDVNTLTVDPLQKSSFHSMRKIFIAVDDHRSHLGSSGESSHGAAVSGVTCIHVRESAVQLGVRCVRSDLQNRVQTAPGPVVALRGKVLAAHRLRGQDGRRQIQAFFELCI